MSLPATLTGYLTGAMDPDEAQVLEAQAAFDPDLSARIETQRAQADDEAPRRGRPPKRSPALDHVCPKGHAGLNAPCKVLTDGRDWFCAARLALVGVVRKSGTPRSERESSWLTPGVACLVQTRVGKATLDVPGTVVRRVDHGRGRWLVATESGEIEVTSRVLRPAQE